MNKNITYRNVNEYIRITFPHVYQSKKYSKETTIENILKKNSDEFKIRINHILKNDKNQVASKKR